VLAFLPYDAADASQATQERGFLENVVENEAEHRKAELEVFWLTGSVVTNATALASADFLHLPDNPDVRAATLTRREAEFAADLAAAQPPGKHPALTTDISGVIELVQLRLPTIARDGRMLVVILGTATPAENGCNALVLGDDAAAAASAAATCLAGHDTPTPGVEYWAPMAGLSDDPNYPPTATFATQRLIEAMVAKVGGTLCPFSPDALPASGCR
jgi:hypothetical protein